MRVWYRSTPQSPTPQTHNPQIILPVVGHGGSIAGSYLADPTSPIPSHCASIVVTSTLRVNMFITGYKRSIDSISLQINLCKAPLCQALLSVKRKKAMKGNALSQNIHILLLGAWCLACICSKSQSTDVFFVVDLALNSVAIGLKYKLLSTSVARM